MKAVLTIAGSDSSGGAGIQADLKTIVAHQLFGESVITALTAQNTTGVAGVLDVDPAFVGAQIDAVFEDIRPDAVKVGMVSSPAIVRAIADGLRRHGAANIVVDPVMVATSGSALIADAAVDALVAELFPVAAVVTPNIPEAEVLAGIAISCAADVEQAARLIADRIVAAQQTAPDFVEPDAADDYLRLAHSEHVWLRGPRIETCNTHGTGCSLSSAIACNLAQGFAVDVAVREAKAYVAGALADGLDLGRGSGPLNHMWRYGPVPC